MPLGKKLTQTLIDFIERQPVFFVATAAPDGRVNMSPKGMDSLRVTGPNSVVWINLSGSGNETAGHLAQLNRMTLMFCAFEGNPLILRLYGTARAHHPHDATWEEVAKPFADYAGARQVFEMSIEAVQTSCGTGVPVMQVERQRGPDELVPFYAEMGPEGVRDYWRRKNTRTIDGFETGVLPD